MGLDRVLGEAVVFERELEFEAFDFDAAFAFVVEDSLVGGAEAVAA